MQGLPRRNSDHPGYHNLVSQATCRIQAHVILYCKPLLAIHAHPILWDNDIGTRGPNVAEKQQEMARM